MRNVVLFMHLSLDGYAAGPNGELDWVGYDEELQGMAAEIVSQVGSPMYGRVTYQLMESYWPTVLDDPAAGAYEKHHAEWVDNVTKFVFSRTLAEVTWKNTVLIRDNIAEEIEKLKQQPGKDLVIFGSPGLAQSLMALSLIDAYWLTINPVILGSGMRLFKNPQDRVNLRLTDVKTFKSGVLAVRYETVRE